MYEIKIPYLHFYRKELAKKYLGWERFSDKGVIWGGLGGMVSFQLWKYCPHARQQYKNGKGFGLKMGTLYSFGKAKSDLCRAKCDTTLPTQRIKWRPWWSIFAFWNICCITMHRRPTMHFSINRPFKNLLRNYCFSKAFWCVGRHGGIKAFIECYKE